MTASKAFTASWLIVQNGEAALEDKRCVETFH